MSETSYVCVREKAILRENARLADLRLDAKFGRAPPGLTDVSPGHLIAQPLTIARSRGLRYGFTPAYAQLDAHPFEPVHLFDRLFGVFPLHVRDKALQARPHSPRRKHHASNGSLCFLATGCHCQFWVDIQGGTYAT